MASYSDLARPVSLAPSAQGEQALSALRQAFFAPTAPSPALAVEQHMRNGADVVSGLMLDRSSSDLFEQSIDAWLASGGLQPYQPPFALPPRQEAQLNRRMAALASQNKPMLPFANAAQNPIEPTMPLSPVTREPSRDRIHQLARNDLAEWLAGLGDRQILKAEGDNVPPKAVQSACQRGLDLAPEFGGDGLTDGAKARARSMVAGNPVSDDTIARMQNFFSRHQKNRADPGAAKPTPGAVAWLMWGGDAGKKWADSVGGGAEKAGESWKKKGYVGPGGAWATAKRKAGGKGEAYARAIYSKMVSKSSGAGSRGGHVIGTTKSGKPIYSSSHSNYSNLGGHVDHEEAAEHVRDSHPHYTKADHLDAADAHDRQNGQGSKHASEAHALASINMKKGSSVVIKSSGILKDYLAKASGAGSRGGNIIGHTKNGRAIYASGLKGLSGVKNHPANENFKNRGLAMSEAKDHAGLYFHKYTASMHGEAASAHREAAQKLPKGSREQGMHLHAAAYHESASKE